MKKSTFLSLVIISGMITSIHAQDIYYTKKGQVSFFSEAPLENIVAHNNEVTSFIDTKKAEIVFSVLIKSFRFEKALMEEHFNTSYLESDKYPKATFNGKVKNPEVVKPEDGAYQVSVEGTLTIHNVSNPLKTTATVIIKNGLLSGMAMFNIRLTDYRIKIPSVVSGNIAEVVEVRVNCEYTPYDRK